MRDSTQTRDPANAKQIREFLEIIMTLQSIMQVQTDRHGVFSRRTFLRSIAAGAAGAAGLSFFDAMTLNAQELRRREMSCILLFMNGGPSQFETFDPKPGHTNGGP